MNDKWFQSSDGTGNLALTIRGFLVALVPLFIIAGKYYGFAPVESDILAWIEGITGGLAAAIVAVGVLRKLFNKF